MRHDLINRMAEEWAQLDPVDPLRELISDAIDALQRKPLTDERAKKLWEQSRCAVPRYLTFKALIETAHGIKGDA